MKIRFIINPVSGNHRFQRNARKAGDRIMKGKAAQEIEYFYTAARGDAYREAKRLAAGSYDLVITVGGDGTINEVIRGLMETGSGIPLAILPAGTSNDFAGFAKIPTSPRRLTRAVKRQKFRSIDIGKANGQHFINVFCGGNFMDIPHGVKQGKKARWGRIAYYYQALKDLKKGFSTSFRLTFTCDGEAFTEDVLFFTLTNSGQAGGYAGLAPFADLEDGKMDLCIIKKANLPQFVIRIFWYTLRKSNPPHVIYRQVEKMRIEGVGCETMPLDIDGEQFEKPLPVDLEVCRHAIQLLVNG